jgi:biotin carboxyl carrier protein
LKLQIKIDGKTYAAEVEIVDEETSEPGSGPFMSPKLGAVPIPAAGAYIPTHTAEIHGADEKQYRSPVTGLAIKVNAHPGQVIMSGDVILVLEAMKMETSVVAHHAGRVKSVHAVPGQPVKVHQILVELE